MSKVKLENISKTFDGKKYVLNNVNLSFDDKSFVVILGPSGCGKSTLLNIIAGLETQTSGKVFINDEDVSNFEPKNRKIGMVFQNYTLYPHLNVFNNLAFALKLKHEKKDEIKKKVNNIAELLKIENLLNRKPHQLSGGQKQRVAIGKALIQKPNVYLFDEPLSSLDANLKKDMCSELITLHNQTNQTFLYVTHDQQEAMALATHIVLLNNGEVIQFGTKHEIEQTPQNLFVAKFINLFDINIFEAHITKQTKHLLYVKLFDKILKLRKNTDINLQQKTLIAATKPQNISIQNNGLNAKITYVENLNFSRLVTITLSDGTLVKLIDNSDDRLVNLQDVYIDINFNKFMFFGDEQDKYLDLKFLEIKENKL